MLAFLLSSTATLFAQLPPFGNPFPLANTRFEAASGSPVLRTNGRDAFLFWTNNKLRVTRIGKYEITAFAFGRAIFDFDVTDRSYFDAVWTGEHFLVIASDTIESYRLFGRLVDGNGVPLGDAFPIAPFNQGVWPRMAFNGKYVLLVVSNSAIVLTADGTPAAGFAPVEFMHAFPQDASLIASNGDRFAVVTPAGNEHTLSMFDANGQLLLQRRLSDYSFRRTALASDGKRFLVAESRDNFIVTGLIEPDGTFGHAAQLEYSYYPISYAPELVWNGSRWVIAYRNPSYPSTFVVETDADARIVLSRTEVGYSLEPSITSVGSRVVMASKSNADGTIYMNDFPLTRSDAVSFTPTPQRLIATATATSSSATLAVWHEAGYSAAIHAGIRTRDGRWREWVLTTIASRAVAASNGRDFLVILDDMPVLLDDEGRITALPHITAFTPEAAASNGRDYAVIGIKDDRPALVLLSPTGAVSGPVVLPYSTTGSVLRPRIASDGAGFFAVWAVPQTCGPQTEPVCFPGGVQGIHLDRELHPADPSPQTFVNGQSIYSYDIGWSGTRYVVAWGTHSGVVASEVGTEGTKVVASASGFNVSVARTAIAWTTEHYPSPRFESRVALLGEGASTVVYQGNDDPSLSVASLPGGELAVVFASVQNGEPLHGTRHVMMSIGAFGLPALPGAPRASLWKEGSRLDLEWSPPPQPVSGYRVEQRLNNGPWIEAGRSFDPGQRFYTADAPAGGSLTLRVRAWNDAGMGEYSNLVTDTVRTRTARH
jgi:hypothetical protein